MTRGVFANLVCLAGIASVAVGLGLAWPPAAWVFCGAVLVFLGVDLVRNGRGP